MEGQKSVKKLNLEPDDQIPRSRLVSKVKNLPKTEEDQSGNTTLVVCFQEKDSYSWYEVNPIQIQNASESSTLTPMPNKINMFAPTEICTVVLASKVYIIGGLYDYSDDKTEAPDDSKTFITDLDASFKVDLDERRAFPMLAAMQGKIYVMGSRGRGHSLTHWGRVFDPKSRQLSAMCNPPDDVIKAPYVDHLLIEDKKVLLVYASPHWHIYNPIDDSWTKHRQLITPGFDFNPAKVAVGGILYRLYLGNLYATELSTGRVLTIYGLEDHIKYVDYSFTDTYLYYLGVEIFCLVWCENGFVGKKRIRCLTFRIHAKGKGYEPQFRTVIQQSASYVVYNTTFVGCFKSGW